MTEKEINILLVTQESGNPSEKMSDEVVREVIEDLKKKHPEITYLHLQIPAGEDCSHPAVNIHQYPSIVINGKQVTAGSIISLERLEELIRDRLTS